MSIYIGIDQNLDYLKMNSHAPTKVLFDSILEKGFLLSITKPMHITTETKTLIDNIYYPSQSYKSKCCFILENDISDHYPCVLVTPDMVNYNASFIERK